MNKLDVNQNEAAKRIDQILGYSEAELQVFMDTFNAFIQDQLNAVSSDDGLQTINSYEQAKQLFVGRDLELYLCQITALAIAQIIEVSNTQANPIDALMSLLAGDQECGPDCDCNTSQEIGGGEGGDA